MVRPGPGPRMPTGSGVRTPARALHPAAGRSRAPLQTRREDERIRNTHDRSWEDPSSIANHSSVNGVCQSEILVADLKPPFAKPTPNPRRSRDYQHSGSTSRPEHEETLF